MNNYRISNNGTTALFNNKFLESLTRTHVAVPITLYLTVAVAILAYAGLYTSLPLERAFYLVPLGMVTFSLVEYTIHRFLFHFEAKTEKQQEFKYKIHGVHHEYPRDKERLVMPPIISIVLAVFFYSVFRLLMNDTVFLFYPGFLAGYCIYLAIHYAVHRFRPPKNIFRMLWTHHALHHYKADNTAFAVSLPIWDYIFGTIPPRGDKSFNESKEKISELL